MIVWPPIAPTEVLPSSINWGPRLAGDTISTSNWSVSTPPGLTIASPLVAGNFTSITISNAVIDITYQITNTITTGSGATEVETVQVTCAPK